MAIIKLMETTIPETYQQELDSTDDLIINADFMPKIFSTLFEGVTECLNFAKNKTKACAFIFEELNGNFIAGALVEYHAGKGDDPGNWSYIWTFNKNDIPENAKTMSLSDTQTHNFFYSIASRKCGFTIMAEYMYTVYSTAIKILSKWLDDNASADDINGVQLDGYFQAQVAIEGDEIVKSIEPIGELKVRIKDDADIEKK